MPLTDIERLDLEIAGGAVDQAAARALEARWLAYIRTAGGASPPSSWKYLGGDVTDCVVNNSGNPTWIFCDGLAGTTVTSADTYTGAALPFRNGCIFEATPGSFSAATQVIVSNNMWLDAIAQGGLPAGTHWWPIAALNDNGTIRVACWHTDGASATPYGTLLDTHIVTLNGYGTYGSHVQLGLGAVTDSFWVDGLVKNGAYVYIYGEEFHPDYEVAYGTTDPPGPHDSYTLKRVARVETANLLNVSAWRFWDGTGWASDPTAAVPLVDTAGDPVQGDAGVKKLGTGRYLLAAHRLADTHLDVYRSSTPQGPWERLCRVPLPVQGRSVDGGVQCGQLVKILPTQVQAPPSVEHSLAIVSRNVLGGPGGSTAGRNIRRYAPQFAVIPHL